MTGSDLFLRTERTKAQGQKSTKVLREVIEVREAEGAKTAGDIILTVAANMYHMLMQC